MGCALVEVEPCSDNCARILAGREHIVLMVSPGNPYFSAARLTVLLRWAVEEMKGADVVMSDLQMTTATYLGQGRPRREACRKARADVRQMASRIRRARESVKGWDIRVSEFGDWAYHPEYRRAHAYIQRAIHHPDYRPLYRQGTREALKARMPKGWEPTEEQIDTGLLHSEKALPFTINAAGILAVPEAVVAYSRPASQARYFFTDGSAFRAFPGQGYIGLRVRA
ncbi:tRNA-dependent cyclodipeptide synthase [Streptomyces zagrosensis]|uniref:Cyclodipeptide synthase n=1 Tax=Streptomyces zagrosensis TaxID=1042984 RepID=A0A7W9UZN0_9ACTN|nr:tRNA-dependent cyclodipeptide synthase [Streptomyces zagrosensis]MBB5937218.1 tRNA-dependent cyclodipeptide synthase [Streptomyces zagrosensis]